MIRPELVDADGGVPGQPRLRVQPSQLLGDRRALRPRFHRPRLQGWLADRGSEPTADDVAAHIAEISATEKFTIPETNYEEVFEITERLGVSRR